MTPIKNAMQIATLARVAATNSALIVESADEAPSDELRLATLCQNIPDYSKLQATYI